MKIKALGHVVLRVTDRARAERFYNGLLGLPICARFDQDGMKMAFFTLGNHHDFAVMEVSGDGGATISPRRDCTTSRSTSAATSMICAKRKPMLEAAGITPNPVDHEVTKSLYFEDPDGNGIELYVDASDVWRSEPQRVAQLMPLEL